MAYVTLPGPYGVRTIANPFEYTGYAVQMISATQGYIAKLGELATSLQPPVIEPDFTGAPDSPTLVAAEKPTLENVIWVAPAIPGNFTGTLDVNSLLPAPFDASPPTLAFPGAPATFTDTIPAAPGVDTNFTYPDLSVSLPAPPSLLSISVSSFGGINMPTISADVPELNLVAPSIREYTPGAFYTSALLTSLKTTLQDRIDNGGTGLAPEVENALWDRGREREYRQADDAIRELDRMESLGYSFPPGVYLDARTRIQTELAYNAQTISREIMIKQAELEQANVLKALDTATQLEGSLINYANQMEQRLFDSSKYATEAGIAIYNGQVQAYSAYVDAYKTKVAIYEAQVRGELAKVEAYKAEIQAEQAKAEVNTALVQQYKIQADVALSNIEIYKAEIAAIQAKAQVEKLKVEIFGEEVRAYAAKVNAYTAGVEGFRAQVQAEGVKQEAFKSQVEAYTAQVTAAAKIADAKIAEFRGLIEAKNAEWEGYKAQAAGETAKVQALSAKNDATTELYKADAQAKSSYNEVLTKQWQVAYEQAQRTTEISIAAAKANADLYQTTRAIATDASKVGAQVAAQLGSAALNAVNFSSSVTTSASTSANAQDTEYRAKTDNTNRNFEGETFGSG